MEIDKIKKIIIEENSFDNCLLYNYHIIKFKDFSYIPSVSIKLSNIHSGKIINILVTGGHEKIYLDVLNLNSDEQLTVGNILYSLCGISSDLEISVKLEEYGGNDLYERLKNYLRYLNSIDCPKLKEVFQTPYWHLEPPPYDPYVK